MKSLIEKLEQAKTGSRELDGETALAIGLYKAWLSKHRWWNFEGLGGKRCIWPDSGIPEYDANTGKKIVLTDTPWPDWVWHVGDVPAYTTSLDAALTLVPSEWRLAGLEELLGGGALAELHSREDDPVAIQGRAETPAIAVCVTALKARLDPLAENHRASDLLKE